VRELAARVDRGWEGASEREIERKKYDEKSIKQQESFNIKDHEEGEEFESSTFEKRLVTRLQVSAWTWKKRLSQNCKLAVHTPTQRRAALDL
jgi:hypothetical protein